jgi:hypothetical protein
MPILNYKVDFSDEEMESPSEIMKSFLMDTSLEELRTLFSDILETCITTDDLAFNTGDKRFDLMMNLRNIDCFIQAARRHFNMENDSNQF